ncbi:hypothetical protein Btru_077652 [Bulinus truncatus]|nr:hypothetical protein Btru_077652 [Bulinus truncatus]
MVQDSGGIQNVHFGITKDGYIFTGYLSELDLIIQDFSQLVGGVVWLVRDGVNYVDESMKLECSGTEETGTLERFVDVMSARTAVGHDKQGKIHMVQIDGKTHLYGINLRQFADLLIELGLHNAINLDGGGSATTVINGTVVNFPSDQCINSSYNCERKVSTVICAHQPRCSVKDCSGHGTCELGVCRCRGHWSGAGCETLSCPNACSAHGLCTEDGCLCDPGWTGVNCSSSCGDGWYGDNCSLPCLCENDALCNAVTGACHCLPGYKGTYCQEVCPLGFFGQDCGQACACEQSCFCHPSTGSCNATLSSAKYSKAVHCLAVQEIKLFHLVPDREYQYSLCMTTVICLSVIASASFLLNVILTFFLVKARQNYKTRLSKKVKRAVKIVRRQSNWGRRVERPNDDQDFNFKFTNFTGVYVDRLEDDGAKTGSGEEEEDLFLAPKK